MQNKQENNFKGKKVLIMGLGLHGGGVSVANFFIKEGAQVRITDLKKQEELLPSLKKIKEIKTPPLTKGRRGGVTYTLGKHLEKDFRWADMVVQNPGVPKESKFLKIAKIHGAQIENEATLFFQIIGRERIIGVTGTRGKSTTTTLIYNIVKEKYPHALIGGNIATSPMFDIIYKAKKTHDPIVLELSSWHLENLGEKELSPHIAVFTNLMQDHLNRYKNLDEYGRAKANIYLHQRENDFLILNWDNFFTLSGSKNASAHIYWFGKKKNIDKPGCFIQDQWVYFTTKEKEEKIFDLSDTSLLGEHNRENILAAICVAKIIGIGNDSISKAIKNFKGLEHRMEFVMDDRGVRYINDTAATTPDGAIAAIKALRIKNQELRIKNIILIAGGSDKGIPQENFNELGVLIQKYCKAVVLFKGVGSEKILKSLPATGYPLLVTDIKTMVDALGVAKSFAKKGDIVLLSPACASFGIFQNEFDRGNQFKALLCAM
ncbi:MAG: UDP-N-acetylmuramoylalanine-D-glutamate ligase [Parcubacteria group bacterium GW2011_GWA2_38_13]|nr:MAG: UDP-N-acetylmuramoylalanine-D-glutamate ligase [Parcubacteria group bacterium GW2011_GWA2_38_13]